MKRIGIIGSGQLGRMTIEESRKFLSYIEVLSPDFPAPAAELADETVIGALTDPEAIAELGDRCDVISYEIEHVDSRALRALESAGKRVIPAAGVLEIIQDKAAQKDLLDANRIPTARWAFVGAGNEPATTEGVMAAAAKVGGFPVVQKSRRGGYDGRGVAVLEDASDAKIVSEGGKLLGVPSFVEAKVPFAKELAVVVARTPDGETAVYPCVEMIFDPRANLCDSVLAPAQESEGVLRFAEDIALRCVRALDEAARSDGNPIGAAGIFGVELFLTLDGKILVNEIAPRPHNSGHFTIEACVTSQFEQYYRILAGLPLGSTELLRPAMMVNLLGEPGADGVPVYLGIERALGIPGVGLHLYGKRTVKPFRKMGHLTAVGRDTEEAVERAEAARSSIRIVAE